MVPASIQNVRVYFRGVSAPIRVVLERYPGGEVLASLVGDPSICALGEGDAAAIRELIHFMVSDLADLSNYPDDALTEHARRRRGMLREILGEPAR